VEEDRMILCGGWGWRPRGLNRRTTIQGQRSS